MLVKVWRNKVNIAKERWNRFPLSRTEPRAVDVKATDARAELNVQPFE